METPVILGDHARSTVKRGKYGKPLYMFLKRTVDITVSLVAIILLLPVFVIISILIAAVDGFPVTYKSKRVGRNGKIFEAYKFRTMVKNADEVLAQHPELLAEFNKTFKLENDPRITKIGNILRKTSVDEFPQLFNVLKGEMSIVGPRPILLSERDRRSSVDDPYTEMIPGCAGLWQCSGRSDTSYEDRIEFDRIYFQKAGVRMDLYIIYRTFISVLKREGAQ